MPSGEVFTAPLEDSVNGKIRFSYPGIYMGQEIEDIVLEVKNGEVVGWDAKKGKALLDKTDGYTRRAAVRRSGHRDKLRHHEIYPQYAL